MANGPIPCIETASRRRPATVPGAASDRRRERPGSRPRLFVLRWLLPCLVFALPVAAQQPAPGQAGVEVLRGAADLVLNYRLRDRDGQTQRLRFRLPQERLAASKRRFHAYRPGELRRLAEGEARRRRQALVRGLAERWPQAEVSLDAEGTIRWRLAPPADYQRRQRQRYDVILGREIDAIRADFPDARIIGEPGAGYRISAQSQRTLDAINRRMDQAEARANAAIAAYAADVQSATDRDMGRMRAEVQAELDRIDQRMAGFADEFFSSRLYRRNADGELLPDYRRIARIEAAELDSLLPPLRAWLRGLGQRAAVQRLLLFTQSIPYDPLDDRADSAGFLPPLQLLAENRGDCDSKSVLFAALAHRLYPDLPIAMALIPGHAYLALGLSPSAHDTQLDWSGRTWVVAEPVGPAISPLGALSDQSVGVYVDEMIRLF